MKNLRFLMMMGLLLLGVEACSASVAYIQDLPVTQTSPVPSPTLAPVTDTPTAFPIVTPSVSATAEPTQTPLPSPTEILCRSQTGRMEFGSLNDDTSDEGMNYRLYLPACYDELPDRHYPVLYLIHGQNATDDQWDRLGVNEIMDRLVAAQELPPFIVVMPRDLVWTSAEEDPFDEELLQGLIPYIDSHYRTLPDRRFRALGGLSRGGGWAVHLGLEHWELFGSVGLHSPAIFWSDVSSVKKWLDAIPRESMPRIYIDIGRNDRPEMLDSVNWFEELLTQRDISHEFHLFAGYHEEGYWMSHLEGYLRWYAANW